MSTVSTIQLGPMERATVERVGRDVKLSFHVGGIALASKVIPAAKARELGDALGFLANDIELPPASSLCAVRPESTWPRNCAKCEVRVLGPCSAACEAKP